jgi:hypothetical protein
MASLHSRSAKENIEAWSEGQAIMAFYGDRTAERSGVPLINHIIEGVTILQALTSDEVAARAFCLHPIYQSDQDLLDHGVKFTKMLGNLFDPMSLVYTMEYRRVANNFLSGAVRWEPMGDGEGKTILTQPHDIILSNLGAVNNMLIADKIQNRKDFLAHHFGKHEKSDILDAYFRLWLERLSISHTSYKRITELLK